MGISTDSVETQRKFKESLNLPYTLLSDEGATVARQYGGTLPALGLASRATYVVDTDGTVKDIARGSDAIDPASAISACPAHKGKG